MKQGFPVRRRLGTRLILLFLVLSNISISVMGWLAYRAGQDIIRSDTFDHLLSISTMKEAQLDYWIDDAKRSLEDIARRQAVVHFVEELKPMAHAEMSYQLEGDELREQYLRPLVAEEVGVVGVFILNSEDGQILVSTERSTEGMYRESVPYFLEGRGGTFVQSPYYSMLLEANVMTASTPIRSSDGETLAVLAARLDLQQMSEIMGQRSGVSLTTETYLVNKYNFFVTESRFEQDYPLTQVIRTEGVEAALRHEDGAGTYTGYRGTPVIGVYRRLPQWELAILTEMGQAEAFAPIRKFRSAIIGAAAIISLMAISVATIFTRTITTPLRKLLHGVQAVGRGDLTHRIASQGRDEVGRLSDAFNEMAGDLARDTASIDVLNQEISVRLLAESEKQRAMEELGAKARELQCLYGLANVAANTESSDESVIQGLADLLRSTDREPDNVRATVTWRGKMFSSGSYASGCLKQAAEIQMRGTTVGTVEFYESGHSVGGREESRRVEENQHLLESVADQLGRVIEQRFTSRELELSHRILELTNKYMPRQSILQTYVTEIRQFTGCSAVGFRWLDDESGRPWPACDDLADEFCRAESCMPFDGDDYICSRILRGDSGSGSLPQTAYGSVHIGSTTRFLASQSGGANTIRTCRMFSGESAVVTPIRARGTVVGLMYVVDERADMATPEVVAMLERTSMQLTGAIQRAVAEETERESRTQLQTIYDGMVDGVLIVDIQTRMPVSTNKAMCTMLGYTEDEMLEMSIREILPPQELEPGAFQRFLDGTESFTRDFPCRRKDGSIFFADIGASSFVFGGSECMAGFFRDSTNRKRTEEALQQMAVGLAHEIRNPLSAIATGIDLLERRKGSSSDTLFEGLREESRRLVDILTNFQSLTRPYMPERTPVDINMVLEEIASLLKRDRQFPNVNLQLDLEIGIERVSCDRDRVRQALWNLMLNGLQSMSNGGDLHIYSRSVDDNVEVEVKDSGCGISKGQIEHIFEPFYTTKDEGSGFGLTIAQMIVTAHGGSISVKSEIGNGTRAVVRLPVQEGETT